MHLIYIDESYDVAADGFIFSAVIVDAESWRTCLKQVRDFRRGLRDSDGIYIAKEFHASEFVAGRGRIASKVDPATGKTVERVVPRGRRCAIFSEVMQLVVGLAGVRVMNCCMAYTKRDWALERLVTRINRFLEKAGSRAIMIFDEGNEVATTRMMRKIAVFNPIPSKFGAWEGSGATKNFPTERILEDPFFKRSHDSYFIQLADFIAYALLRREFPVPSKTKYGLDKAFEILLPVLVTEAHRKDPCGVIR